MVDLKKSVGRRLAFFLFVLGAFLIIVNIYGLSQSLRPTELQIPITKEEFFKETRILTGESDLNWARRMTFLVHIGIKHFWDTTHPEKTNISLPIWENWLIFLFAKIYPQYQLYEFFRKDKIVERGLGLCSQHAILLSAILRDKGMSPAIIGLNGHVVVGLDEGAGMVLDPDYGVVIPYSIAEIQKKPKIIADFYTQKASRVLRSIYQDSYTLCPRGSRDYQPRRSQLEPVFYSLKWLIPILLCIPYLLLITFSKKLKHLL
ncbi:hypothetical protein [Desulfovibrio oxyclinae]|uniref:hypothetical protein n=1 Tax=Desulfovibrio oxyclinae TaxID=63560 RepID=UPI0012E99C30|nr:hypothetical protein [Desulfovibrio oxyclinae]